MVAMMNTMKAVCQLSPGSSPEVSALILDEAVMIAITSTTMSEHLSEIDNHISIRIKRS